MKILQLGTNIVNTEWHYRYSIFQDEENGTEVSPVEGIVECRSWFRREGETLIDKYKSSYEAKEIYVSSNGQGNERD